MHKKISAPLLGRVKSWQLIGLGISGWCTLYSIAIITCGASSALIGNAQGGCFAATMTLASLEAKRFKNGISIAADPLQWLNGVSTEQINQSVAQFLQKREFKIEACQQVETEMGFGVRAVNSGRTLVYETGRWQEPVIDLAHAQTTEENRIKVSADLAIIVGVGNPDEDAMAFAKSRPLNFLAGEDLKEMLKAETTVEKKA